MAQRHKTNEPIDDEDGHYIVNDGSRLGDRYTLQQLLGQGTFGKVVRATDVRTRREVAVKIIRAVPKVGLDNPSVPSSAFTNRVIFTVPRC